MSSIHTASAALVSLLALGATPAAGQTATLGLVREELNVRMPLALEEGARCSWSVRRNGWSPLGERGAASGGELALRLDLDVLARSEDGAWALELTLAPLCDERAVDARPFVLSARVDADGGIEALEPREHEHAAGAPPLSLAELRLHLEAILGTGLHQRVLARGDVLELGELAAPRAIEARALRSHVAERLPIDRLEAVLLRLDAVRQARGERTAVFSLIQPAAAPGEEPGRAVGEASYVASDGLLRTLAFKPRTAEVDAKGCGAHWLVIERIESARASSTPARTEEARAMADG